MKKFRMIILLICLLCIIPTVNASLNDSDVSQTVNNKIIDGNTDNNNLDSRNTNSITEYNNNNISYKLIDNTDDSSYKNIKSNSNTNTVKHSSKIVVSNLTATYSDKVLLRTTVVDKTLNDYVYNGKVLYKINGITVGTSNIKNGKAFFVYDTSSLKSGKYTISAVYAGSSTVNSNRANGTLTINKIASRLVLSNVNVKTNTSTTLSVKVYDSKNRLVDGGIVVFKVNGISISQATVKGGAASITYTPLNVVRNYTLSAVYGGTTRYASSTANSKLIVSLKIYTINWLSKGNIKKNTVLYNSLPKTAITNELVNCASYATPYVILGDGNGKCVFVVAGIHGNELSSQLAAVRLINNLCTKTVHGTVYIFPFVAPSYTGNITRTLNGVNLNSVAHKSGTLSNKLVNFAKSRGAVSLGDFHCTQPGGKPGRNAVFGSYNPLRESATLSKYISTKTSSSSIVYNKAGVEYPGAVEDYCNKRGIVSVTCEVKTPHGSIASGSSEKSYSMMNSYLNYYKLI